MSDDLPDTGDIVATLHADLARADQRLGLSSGMLQRMVGQIDSVSVIMMIAAIETVLNELIQTGLRQPTGGLGGRPTGDVFGGLAEVAQALPLDGGRGSKLEFARRLDLIDDSDFEFIRSLATVRNRYAHTIRNAERTLHDLINEMLPNNGRLFERLTYGHPNSRLEFPTEVTKFIVVLAFSTFLSKAERTQESLSGGIMSLLGTMIDTR